MGTEIERKFLVKGSGWKALKCVKRVVIKQGYLSKAAKHTVRIRVTDTKAMITIKGPTKGITRSEYEYEIPLEDGLELIEMCDAPIINKTRYVMKDQHDQIWEVDEFRGINEGLLVAEIEIPTEDTHIVIPEWIGREVSHDRRYTNAYLTAHHVPQE